jgi:hypothetical protein
LSASVKLAAFVLMGGVVASQLISVLDHQRDRIWNALVAGAAIAML